MTNLDSALHQLREERGQAELQVRKLEDAISTLEGLIGTAQNGTRLTRTVSAAVRARIAKAQKARWARVRANTNSPTKKTLSIGGRRRIAAAQRARWATVKAKAKRAA